MKKDDILLILLALFLLTAVLVTIFLGGNKSRHGYGFFSPTARGSTDTVARHCHVTGHGVNTRLKSQRKNCKWSLVP